MPIEEIHADDSDRRFDPMAPGLDPAHMRKRHGEANRPVAAHAEVSDIVEENDAGRARRVMRFAKERADERVVAARLVDGGAAEMIELAGEASEPFGKRTFAQRRPAIDDDASGLALRMGVYDTHRAQSFAPRHEAYQARKVSNRRFARLSWDGLRASKA